MPDIAAAQARWVKVIDQSVCIGCHACTTACKSENDVPLGVNRTYVKYVDAGIFPQVRRSYQVTRCNQCADAPCVAACPTAAMYRRPDGIVDFDKRICVGCKACMAACPYDAIFINPDDHSAEKCNLCAHRLEIGLEPSCVVVCPVGAILVGDAGDPTSAVARIVAEVPTAVRRPEIGTGPNLHYVGAGRETLDPLAARRPGGGIFMWSEQGGDGPRQPAATADTAPVLAYDVPHRIPWDWRVSLYTWTKGVAAGAWLVAVALWVAGTVGFSDDLVRWAAPGTAAVFLALTAGILVWDLEHPERFWLILLRPQWRSWLVRGGFILSGYALILGAHLVASVLDAPGLAAAAAVPGVPLGVMAAVYTAWLFAACKGRDLWQSRLLPAHLAVQAVLAGAAALLVADAALDGAARDALAWVLAGAAAAHLGLVAGEVAHPHPSAHARLAVREMTSGRYAAWFRTGVALAAAALAAPVVGPWAAPFALAGLGAYEHAYVQAGQSVPLA